MIITKCPCCNCDPISYIDKTDNRIVMRCPDINCDFPYAVGGETKEKAINMWNSACSNWMKESKK